MIWGAHNSVEVDHTVERSISSNPLIDSLTHTLLRFRVVAQNCCPFGRHDRRAYHSYTAGMRARNKLRGMRR